MGILCSGADFDIISFLKIHVTADIIE